MGRKPCCAKEGMNRGAWSAMEDEVLANYVKVHGQGKWRHLSQKAGLQRCGKSCRLRWMNYLRPDIKRGNISAEEEELIVRLHKLLGNRWSLIAGRLPGRTDNEIKNYWNTNLTKRVQGHKNSTSKATKPNYSDLQLNKLGKLQEDTDEHRVIQNKAEKCTNTLGVKSYMDENTSGREEESESPSSSALQFEENLTDFDFNELLAPDASILTFHGIEQVDGNDKDVAGNVGYGHGFSLYMDDFELFSSINEAKPSYEVAAVDHFITTETMDVRSLETYLDLEDVWIN